MVQNLQQGVPPVPNMPMVDANRNPTGPWFSFFVNLWNRTGGASGALSGVLDSVTDIVGSIIYRGAAGWTGLAPGNHYNVMRMGLAFPEWDVLDGNSFAQQVANSFLAAPALATGTPGFRLIATADLNSTAGQYPGTGANDNAAVGNVGEDFNNSASAVSLTSTVTKDIVTLAITAGDWDVWGSLTTAPAAGTTQSVLRAWINTTTAADPGAPNNGCYLLLQTTIGATLAQCLPLGSMRISTATPITLYLSANVTFAISTLTAGAFIAARRRR